MKKLIILQIAVILSLLSPVKAQVYPKTNENGKFGYVNAEGAMVVSFELEEAGYLKNGMAKFKKDGKYGFINEEGRIIVPPKYEETGSFNTMGYCWVCARGRVSKDQTFNGSAYGIINKEGKEIIPARYAEVGSFGVIIENKEFYMYDGKEHPNATYPHIDACATQTQEKTNWMHIPSSELPISAIPYFWYSEESANRRAGLVDKDGNIIFENKRYYTVFPPLDGMALLRINDKGSLHIAYFNIETKQLLRPPFNPNEIYHPFKCSVAQVEVKDKGYYFINKQMKPITPLFKNTGSFQEGLCPVLDAASGLCGVIDSTGNTVAPCIYKAISSQYSEDLLRVQGANGWGCIDKKGKVVIPLKYSDLHDFKFGWAAAQEKEEGKWGYIDKNDSVMISFAWEAVASLQKPYPEHIWCKEQGKWYSYSYLRKCLNFKQGYDAIYNYDDEEYFIVANDKKFGVIHKSGTEIIPLALDNYDNTVAALEYMKSLHKPTLEGIDLYRYLLYMPSAKTNSFRLSDEIPSALWDY